MIRCAHFTCHACRPTEPERDAEVRSLRAKLAERDAEIQALRAVVEAARSAHECRNEPMLGPARMNDLGHALAKVLR